MCGFPLTRSYRHNLRIATALRQAVRVLLSPALSSTTSPPITTVPRSNGSRGVPSGILLTTHTHTHTHIIPTLPLCTKHRHTHKHIFIYTHECVHHYIVVVVVVPHPSSRPRSRHQGSLYCVIGISRRPSHFDSPVYQPFPPHPHYRGYNARRPSGATGPPCSSALAYTNSQCLQPGSPGHLFSAAFTHKFVNNPWAQTTYQRVLPCEWWHKRSRLRCMRVVHEYILTNNNIIIYTVQPYRHVCVCTLSARVVRERKRL